MLQSFAAWFESLEELAPEKSLEEQFSEVMKHSSKQLKAQESLLEELRAENQRLREMLSEVLQNQLDHLNNLTELRHQFERLTGQELDDGEGEEQTKE